MAALQGCPHGHARPSRPSVLTYAGPRVASQITEPGTSPSGKPLGASCTPRDPARSRPLPCAPRPRPPGSGHPRPQPRAHALFIRGLKACLPAYPRNFHLCTLPCPASPGAATLSWRHVSGTTLAADGHQGCLLLHRQAGDSSDAVTDAYPGLSPVQGPWLTGVGPQNTSGDDTIGVLCHNHRAELSKRLPGERRLILPKSK